MEKTNKIELVDHGIMLSDYFSGTSGVMLSIPIDNKTTVKEVIEGIKDEINMMYDHIEYTAEYHNFEGSLEKCIDRMLKRFIDWSKIDNR